MNSSANFDIRNDWKLVWSDEFDYTGLPDPQKWNFEIQKPGWVNNESQNYVKRLENCRVENGVLIIEARRDWFEGYEYSSARINTRNKTYWTYGRFEARMKLPSGHGVWPAFWMMPNESTYGSWPKSGEIDIMEYVGHKPGVIHSSIHTELYNWIKRTEKTSTYSIPDCSEAYHVYAVEWFPNWIEFYIDNIRYFAYSQQRDYYKEWPFNKGFYLILNLAIGGNWGGLHGIDNSIFPQQMCVDYVRAFQRDQMD